MTEPSGPEQALMDEARTWLRRLTSGSATEKDLAALNKWRETSPRHAQAFAEAALLWNVLGDVTAVSPISVPARTSKISSGFSRRAFIGGGVGLAASVSALAIVRPPFGMWPSFAELRADYRTDTGERRQIEVARAVSVEMNTRTSINLRSSPNHGTALELLNGEATVAKKLDPTRAFVVVAGEGRTSTNIGSFDIRKDGGSVCVTCVAGEVLVQHAQGKASLQTGKQLTYNDRTFGKVTKIDGEIVTAWQRGLLIFRDTPLDKVIDEVNRYRSGRIVLINEKLGKERVVADFRLDDLDAVIEFVTRVMNVTARSLPGGIVLLG
jgi:transmembrane sensor